MSKKILLKDFARMKGKAEPTARQMARTGGFKTAEKLGRDWIIDPDEEWPDRRVKSGKYIGQRKKKTEKAE